MHRNVVSLGALLLVTSLVLSACGDGSALSGTWVPDMDAMKPDIDKMMGSVDMADIEKSMKAAKAMIDRMPDGPAKDAALKQMGDAGTSTATMPNPVADFAVTFNGDGTYAVLKGKVERERGTWSLDGETLSITPTSRRGKQVEKKETRKGTFKGGRIHYKPDDRMPFAMVLKPQ